jgi:hypothetical protein
VLDEIVQIRGDTRAAKRLLNRLLRKQGCRPRRMITDKLASYGAARRIVIPSVEYRQHKGLNNRAENAHVPFRKRERAMQGFRSWSALKRFVETFSAVRNLFVPPRSRRAALRRSDGCICGWPPRAAGCQSSCKSRCHEKGLARVRDNASARHALQGPDQKQERQQARRLAERRREIGLVRDATLRSHGAERHRRGEKCDH